LDKRIRIKGYGKRKRTWIQGNGYKEMDIRKRVQGYGYKIQIQGIGYKESDNRNPISDIVLHRHKKLQFAPPLCMIGGSP
jgi:hypothetical protein